MEHNWYQTCGLYLENFQSLIRSIKIRGYALAYAYRHPQTPWYAKLAIIVTLGYLLSPIDLIPDFIPILGYLDDFILVPLLIMLSIKLLPQPILDECEERARKEATRMTKPKKSAWWFAILVIIFYILLLLYILRWIQ